LRVIDGDQPGEPSANLQNVELSSSSEVNSQLGSGPEASSNAARCAAFEPPASLPADLQEKWRQIVADLKERRLWKDSMESLVTSFVLAGATVERLELKIALEGEQVPGAGGAQKPHPGTGLLRSSRQTLERLGAELGITPTSRARKSLQPGPNLFSRLGNEWDL
jgi:P27 family predicted phage terminase small subunit